MRRGHSALLGVEVWLRYAAVAQIAQNNLARNMSHSAFLSRRVVTPDGIKPRAVLVQDGRILDVVPLNQVPAEISVKDFGEAAIVLHRNFSRHLIQRNNIE